ncbi:hypothetical protein [Methanopyrus sp.]
MTSSVSALDAYRGKSNVAGPIVPSERYTIEPSDETITVKAT